MQSVDISMLRAACEWANDQKNTVETQGDRLVPGQIRDAKLVGVQNPDSVRVHLIASMPVPTYLPLREMLARTGLLTESTTAFTFGHAILIRREYANNGRVLVHELARVSQYERLNGIEGFLSQWLWEVENLGEARSPMALAARLVEERLCGSRSATAFRWSSLQMMTESNAA